MLIRYEATFEGLLTAIAACLRSGRKAEVLMPDLDQLSLLPCQDIAAEPGIRNLFRKHLIQVLGSDAGIEVYDTAYAAFLSDDEGIGMPIFHYLSEALRLMRDPSGNLIDRDVSRVVSTAQRVNTQAHAFLGLIRFRQVAPTLYLSDFTPDYHILPLILPHFCERLPDQPFVIRDLRRDLAAVHVPGRPVCIFVLAPPELFGSELDRTGGLPLLDAPNGVMRETETTDSRLLPASIDPFDQLWRRYLSVLSIPERRNLNLQRANMPKKYWKYLTEQPGKPQPFFQV